MVTRTSPVHVYDRPRPVLTTDVVIFTLEQQGLQVLLTRRQDAYHDRGWALPGGPVAVHEDLEHRAQRELRSRTGLEGIYLEQLYTFGQPERDPRERIITVAYFALLPSDRLVPVADDAPDAWFAVDALPPLPMDQGEIIAVARERLAGKLAYSTIAFQLLPGEFTLGDLQEVYEAVLRERQDKRNFRKWALGLGRIEATGRERRNGAHRPARLYRVREPRAVEIIK
ncbi:MAG TPA: NUDIX domain-containing protein [Gammaproteobacteria bacterium]|nr:NUDIX domain-containing protein [Gammaproteobacteria bacterium]